MPKPKTNEEIIAALRSNDAYKHIDIDRELKKADAWCLVNNRRCTPKFFVNWLNRIDPPLGPQASRLPPASEATPSLPDDPVCPFCGTEYCLKFHREERGL